jgi:SAM-dependent methyltransferase
MTSSSGTLYDKLQYPDHIFEYTHPNRLAALGKIYGMDPSPAENCRMLELGCGAGGNIIPMAYQNPHSIFVGIDLSRAAVERGQQKISAMGLTNIRLIHCDIMEVDAKFGQFDYIVTHGVYSWVPPTVRNKIMAILQEHLSPHGIGYVSYNAQPFSHLRDYTRDMMLYHTREITDPAKKVGQARAVMKFLSENSRDGTLHRLVMRDQYERVVNMSDEVLFHDDLNASAEAFLLHEVVAHASSHGLQYLSDAVFSRRYLARYSDEVRATLQGFPDSEFMSRDQYQDFIDGHGFRRTLLCHDGISLQRKVAPDFVKDFYLLGSTEPVDASWSLTDDSPMQFKNREQSEVTASQPLVKAALLCLGKAWPGALTFAQLLAKSLALLESAHTVTESDEEDFVATIAELTFSGEIMFLHTFPKLATAISDRPAVSLLARMQAETGSPVTNLLHQRVWLTDERARRFAQLLDGTRTHEEIIAEMAVVLADTARSTESLGQATEPDSALSSIQEDTQRALATIRKLGLLIG